MATKFLNFFNYKYVSGALSGAASVLFVSHFLMVVLDVNVDDIWHHILPFFYCFLFLLSLRGPIHKTLIGLNSDIKPLLYVIEWFFVLSVISIYLAVRYLEPPYFIIISIFISGSIVAIGWWVQGIIATARLRRQHTVNTIIQTRISDVYQRNLHQFNKCFGSSTIFINKKVAQEYSKYKSLTKEVNTKEFETRKLEESLAGAMYLLNFFEFISAGIQKRDLDSVLMQECFKDFVKNLERKCFYILWVFRENEVRGNVFKEFEWLAKQWLGESSLLYKAKRGERIDSSVLGKSLPAKEWRIQK